MNHLSPGFRFALAATALVVALLVLAGCATGVTMSDAEVISCRNEGCAAFTENELLTIMGRAYKDGYLSGWKDAGKQMGRVL